jgi:hypothetical protein
MDLGERELWLGSDDALSIRARWADATGVAHPPSAATWCEMRIEVRKRPVTLFRDERTDKVRDSVPVGAYAAAEWVAQNWWVLQHHLRPAALPSYNWRWHKVRNQTWLRGHNLRGAGGGYSWPDLTILPEGSDSRLCWFDGPGLQAQPLRFLTRGDESVPAGQVADVLRGLVEACLARLEAVGIANTPLQLEWALIQDSDAEEADFARAAARMGLDPYHVAADTADLIVAAHRLLTPEARDEFYDSARPQRLPEALEWIRHALPSVPVSPSIADFLPPQGWLQAYAGDTPWNLGYAAARLVRTRLGLSEDREIQPTSLIASARSDRDGAGVRGLVVASEIGSGLLLAADASRHPNAERFAVGTALGLTLLRPERHEFLLDPAPTPAMRSARAFSAELLAPAAGIAAKIDPKRPPDPDEIEELAAHYSVSPDVIRHQYENQIAA